jgi:hypothetical protein
MRVYGKRWWVCSGRHAGDIGNIMLLSLCLNAPASPPGVHAQESRLLCSGLPRNARLEIVVLYVQAVAVQVITSMRQALQVLASRLGAGGFIIGDNHRALYDGPVLGVSTLRADHQISLQPGEWERRWTDCALLQETFRMQVSLDPDTRAICSYIPATPHQARHRRGLR